MLCQRSGFQISYSPPYTEEELKPYESSEGYRYSVAGELATWCHAGNSKVILTVTIKHSQAKTLTVTSLKPWAVTINQQQGLPYRVVARHSATLFFPKASCPLLPSPPFIVSSTTFSTYFISMDSQEFTSPLQPYQISDTLAC